MNIRVIQVKAKKQKRSQPDAMNSQLPKSWEKIEGKNLNML